MRRAELSGAGLLVLAATGFGTLGVLARYASEAGVGPLGFVAWRAIIASGVVFATVLVMRRSFGGGLERLRGLSRMDRLQLLTLGGLNVAINAAMFTAFDLASIGVALICFYAYPAIVAVAAVRIYGESLDARRLGALVLATAGMLLVVLGPGSGDGSLEVAPAGVALGLLAAALQAAYALIAGRGFASVPAAHASAAINGITAAGSVALALLLGAWASLVEPLTSTDAWIWLLLAGTIGAAIPSVAILIGFRTVGPTRASIVMLLEPVVAVSLAAILLAERPAASQVLGGLMVLAGAALLHVGGRRASLAVEGPPAM